MTNLHKLIHPCPTWFWGRCNSSFIPSLSRYLSGLNPGNRLYLKPHRDPSPFSRWTFLMKHLLFRGLDADCPILRIITIPEVCSRPECGFPTFLGTLGSKGFPAIWWCCNLERSLATDIHHRVPGSPNEFPTHRVQMCVAWCFSRHRSLASVNRLEEGDLGVTGQIHVLGTICDELT